MDQTNDHLLGRERECTEIHDWLSDPDGPRLVLVRGERGTGRTTFVQALGDRLRARGTAALAVTCVPADGERPLLLALRLVMALEEHRLGAEGQRPTECTATQALSAVDRRDRTAMDSLLHTALTRSLSGPVTVLIDDAQYADPASLDALRRIDFPQLAPEVRLVVSAAWHGERGTGGADGPGDRSGPGGTVEQSADVLEARTVVLPRLGLEETTALVTRRLQARPDAALARRAHELTRGIPGAVDALLTGWTRQGDVRIADGHAFLHSRAPVPVLPDNDRFVAALDAPGEPARAVAGALSVLWPLGLRVPEMIAASAGLSPGTVGEGLRDLVEAGIVDELPDPDGTAIRGWTFRLPLIAHTVLERLRPMQRAQLSAAAVRALWGDAPPGTAVSGGRRAPRPAVTLLDEVDARSYLPDRIADASILVDRARAVAELTAAAERVHPDPEGLGMLRWLRAATQLVEQPAARDLVLHRYARAAYVAGDHQTGQIIAEALLRNPGKSLTELDIHEAACLLVAVTANAHDWPALSRLVTASWWDELPVPALARVLGQALALCRMARWQEAEELLARTEPVWNTSPRGRTAARCFSGVAQLMLGRPESFRRELALPEAPELPPEAVYAFTVSLFDELAAAWDLNAAKALLDSRGLSMETLPPFSRFLWLHLAGRWDEALEPARRLLANNEVQTSASDSFLLPARTAAILLAQGRITGALRALESTRGMGGGPPQYSLDAVEAEVHRTLGDLEGADKTLRRALDKAQTHAQVSGTDELWALRAELLAETGHTAEASTCLEHLGRIADRTGGGRTRLRHLVASARVLRQDDPDTARASLREAVELARSRGLPFETATTLVAAVEAGAGPATLLHEAYEVFGVTGAALWRFHTRTALREAGLTGPGRKQATAENEHLLAVLIAEGLTNRQIAAVMRLSEDAVANRLSRLFARTGLRSRTEVVTAVRTGCLPSAAAPGQDRHDRPAPPTVSLALPPRPTAPQ
ncbi:AAA family ATPase [Streptomyces antibioticus]|uniref:AAA family ATPase n=1 Tax=Streptomyces antibioticus TaxID=1890 RepID=UPI00367A1C22